MKKKLTLRMDQQAIERAKDYAEQRGTSVSKLVEQFFEALDGEERSEDVEASPLVQKLSGIGRGEDIAEDDYLDYLEDKHR